MPCFLRSAVSLSLLASVHDSSGLTDSTIPICNNARADTLEDVCSRVFCGGLA